MNVLCIGDIHVKTNNLLEIDEMTTKLIQLATERKPDFIVVLGDVLDRHATIHVACLMRAEKIILSLSKIAPVFLLIGNHDRPNNSNFLTDEHPFNSMKLWNNTYIIDTVKSFNIFKEDEIIVRESNSREVGMRFVFAPYVAPGRFMEALNTIDDPLNCECIFSHQEFRGAKMGAIVSEEGDVYLETSPLCLAGHIHDYQHLQPNIIYVGVPIMHTFSDTPDKTVSMFTFELGNIWKQERIDLGLIKKTTIYLTTEEFMKYNHSNDKMVKLVIKGDEASIQACMKLDKVNQLKKLGVKFSFKTVQTTKEAVYFAPKMSFRDHLLTEITKPEAVWFNKIFC